ncbi:MAG TPA: ACP S-malonyltransferase [Promineifilum sp.]|nr:ACP S-malonyltransferase [Promineifilum sp.]HRO91733.1 ACP S-malonyltransferase [Promineifilum sp.]HRQ11789.1 ACP S-malonyltransferase [Promineifilum sp.]
MSTAFLFPGQGSQFVGMGRDLYDREPVARALFDEADALLGIPLSQLCFEGPESALTDTAVQQPALFTTSLAAWAVLQQRGKANPTWVAGHSLGEFSALAAAEAMSFADGLALVRRRGELMKLAGERSPGGMAAVLGLDAAPVAELCARAAAETGQYVGVANDNCPGQIVISGHNDALPRAIELITAAGARKVVRLPISIAAHTPLMATVADEFAAAIDATPFSPTRAIVVGNVNAHPVQAPHEIRAELKAQLTSPVRWTESVRYLNEQGVDTYLEVGPGDVLLGLVKRIDKEAQRVKFEI